MESLRGPLLNVVLKIREGKGFAFLKSPIAITANLNGNALESDTIPCSPSPILDSEFVWEAEKAVLRRMRSGNTSLRIELFTQESTKKRNRIGYILINFKQAQIVKTGPSPSLIENWYRLLGVKVEAKPHNPEILLSLFIKEADFNVDSSSQKPKKSPEASTKGNQRSADKEQGYIQVGPQSVPCQIFTFTVKIRSAVNLTSLVSGGVCDEKLVIEFAAFSTCYTTGNMAQVNGDIYGESLVLTLRSSFSVLSAYFTEFPSLQFHLLHARTPVASTALQLQSSLPSNGQEDWSAALASNKGSAVLQKDSRLFFDSEAANGNSHAYIDVSVTLELQAKSTDQHLVKPFTISQSPRKAKQEVKKKIDCSKSYVCGQEGGAIKEMGSGDGIPAVKIQAAENLDKALPSCGYEKLESVVFTAESESRQVNNEDFKINNLEVVSVNSLPNSSTVKKPFTSQILQSEHLVTNVVPVSKNKPNISDKNLVSVNNFVNSVPGEQNIPVTMLNPSLIQDVFPKSLVNVPEQSMLLNVEEPPRRNAQSEVQNYALSVNYPNQSQGNFQIQGPSRSQNQQFHANSVPSGDLNAIKNQIQSGFAPQYDQFFSESSMLSMNITPGFHQNNPCSTAQTNQPQLNLSSGLPQQTDVLTSSSTQVQIAAAQVQRDISSFPSQSSVESGVNGIVRNRSCQMVAERDCQTECDLRTATSAPSVPSPSYQPPPPSSTWERNPAQASANSQPSQTPFPNEGNSVAVQEMTKKVVEELEDWKEKQQILYKSELKKKLEREIKRLTDEWVARQSQLESEMRSKVEESCSLTQQLHRTAADLQARLTAVSKTQNQLDDQKADLEKKYSLKLEQLREASKRHHADTQLMVSQLKIEKEELEARLCASQRENERLRSMTGGIVGGSTPASPMDQLSDHQTTSLLLDLKGMEEKLATALESKEFFRKEWGRALREIHKMKSEQELVMRQQLETQRHQLESLRMVNLIEENEKGKEQDLFSIKDLRSQIEQLNTARSSS